MVFFVTFALVYLQIHVTSAGLLGLPLDIGGLLSSLHPASPNDPRFTNFDPPGPGDGMISYTTIS